MPRTSRRELAGAIHHITAKSPSRRLLFQDDDDHQRYLQLLAREIREREWRLLTYCQLSNHLHLLVETPDTDLGPGFKRIHEDYGRYVNRRREESGHLFGARFYNRVVRNERHLLACLRYIARNPVEAGICRDPREWPWSAHRALAGLAAPPSFLDIEAAYEHLGQDPREARLNYLRLVARSDQSLLADLELSHPDDWLRIARHDFEIPADAIASHLGVSRSTAYARLAKLNRNEGTVPSFRTWTGGTVP